MKIKFPNVKCPTNSMSLLVALCFFIVVTIYIFYKRQNEYSLIFLSPQKNFPAIRVSRPENGPTFKVVFDPWSKIDVHDEAYERVERGRKGNGEQGKPATLPSNYDRIKFDEAFRINGFNGLLSDYISVDRSVPDFRHEACQKMKYRQYLPDASVILSIRNHHWSTLLRTLYSILNRSPPELIKEIILVDDNSTESQTNEKQLDNLVASSILSKVRILHVRPPPKGLIMAKSLGAHNASGQILVFLDAQTEVGINWLPPLLEPFMENYKSCVCPIVDEIDRETFGIENRSTSMGRDAFDWNLDYKNFPLLAEDKINPNMPYRNPVMSADELFAISSRFFSEIGGYDTELQDRGGEQYELSFKIWQCGGTILKVPCSRVAHIIPNRELIQLTNPAYKEFIGWNYKRIAEVWMDEYAQYLYVRKPEYNTTHPGDLSQQRAIRKRLKCKSFKWYMDEIAFDVVRKYPLNEPPAYGSGKIRPIDDDQFCLTVITVDGNECVELSNCLSASNNNEISQFWQEFLLSWHKDLEIKGIEKCLDGVKDFYMAPISVNPCHRQMGNQLWQYNLETQQLIFGSEAKRCLTYDVQRIKVFLETCKNDTKTQKWIIDSINEDAIKLWNKTVPLVA